MWPDGECQNGVVEFGGKCVAGDSNVCADATCDTVTSGASDCNVFKVKYSTGVDYANEL
jgi:hypothetical protein